MTKKALNGAKLQAKLEMSPQRSYVRDLRRSWDWALNRAKRSFMWSQMRSPQRS